MTASAPDPARGGTPFYILAPRYDRTSAGGRVLHQLAAELEDVGHEAFIVWTGPKGVDYVEEVGFKHLTEAVSIEHFKTGRTPVCIRPEVSHTAPPVGIDVVYVLNFPGLLGGPAELSADYVLAYSERLARSLPRCDGIVHLPACDPEFWTADPQRERTGACVYAGKYVEQHGQQLPPELADATVITRSGPRAPTPEQIREVLRSSTHCYVFENTSIVTEALLCGCPVVFRRNPFFSELIASEEQGAWGMTEEDDRASIEAARAELRLFRAKYLEGFERARHQVRAFADQTRALARERRAPCAFPVPRRIEARVRGRLRGLSAPADDADVAFSYNLLLGREVEGPQVFATARGAPLGRLMADLARSAEYAAAASRFVEGGAHPPELTVMQGLEVLKAWAERRLPLSRKTRQALRAGENWPAVHATLISDPCLAELVEGAGLPVGALTKRLLDFSVRPDMRGHVDEIAAGRVSGWALDLNRPEVPVRVEVTRGDRLLVETVTGGLRPDVARLAGGDGRAGFVIRTPLIEGGIDEVQVRVGPLGTTLPSPRRTHDGGAS